MRLFRLLRFLFHVMRGIATVALVFPFIGRARQVVLTQDWTRFILAIFGVGVQVSGHVPPVPARRILFVANHISWLDVALLMAQRPARFIAKSEIRAWPVLGWLSERAGTLFIERRRHGDAGRINRMVHAALAQDECVAFFPEGTTSRGDLVQPFNTALLQPAVESHAPLWPVGIRYPVPGGEPNPVVAFVGDTTFSRSLWTIMGEKKIEAELIYAPPIDTEGKNRRELARLAEEAIASALSLTAPRKSPGTPAGPPDAPPTARRPTGSPSPAQ